MQPTKEDKEAWALVKFVEARLRYLQPKPTKITEKWKYEKDMKRFRQEFFKLLEESDNDLYGTVWQYFEEDKELFYAEHGMRELAVYTQKMGHSWIYENEFGKRVVVYKE